MAQPQERKWSELWTTVKVPKELDRKITEFSRRSGKAKWKIVLDAIALYETTFKKPKAKEELPKVDKVLWYIEKLAMSVGALKERPTNDNLQRTLRTAQQVRERLGVDTSLLERAITEYVRAVNAGGGEPVERHELVDEVTLEVNMALKSVLVEMFYKHILKEE